MHVWFICKAKMFERRRNSILVEVFTIIIIFFLEVQYGIFYATQFRSKVLFLNQRIMGKDIPT